MLDAVVAVEHRHRQQDRAALVGAEEDGGGLRQRRQQRGDAVAALDAVRLEHVREPVREVLELAEAHPALVAAPVLPDHREPVARRACRRRRARCCSARAPPSGAARASRRSCRAGTCESPSVSSLGLSSTWPLAPVRYGLGSFPRVDLVAETRPRSTSGTRSPSSRAGPRRTPLDHRAAPRAAS